MAFQNVGIYEEIFKNMSNKYQSVVTTLSKTINNISVTFSYYFKTRYKFVLFFFTLDELL